MGEKVKYQLKNLEPFCNCCLYEQNYFFNLQPYKIHILSNQSKAHLHNHTVTSAGANIKIKWNLKQVAAMWTIRKMSKLLKVLCHSMRKSFCKAWSNTGLLNHDALFLGILMRYRMMESSTKNVIRIRYGKNTQQIG